MTISDIFLVKAKLRLATAPLGKSITQNRQMFTLAMVFTDLRCVRYNSSHLRKTSAMDAILETQECSNW